MNIEIDDDFADTVVVASLVESYVSITKDLKTGKVWHEDDEAAFKELLPALKIVGDWYCVDFDAEVKKFKKVKK
jgi:hypothetical protein